MQSVSMSDANAIVRDATRQAMKLYGLDGLGAIDPAAWEEQVKETGTTDSGFDWAGTIAKAVEAGGAIASSQIRARADEKVARYTREAEAMRIKAASDAAAARASGIPYPYGQPVITPPPSDFPTWVIPVGIGVVVLGGLFMMRGRSGGGGRRRRR